MNTNCKTLLTLLFSTACAGWLAMAQGDTVTNLPPGLVSKVVPPPVPAPTTVPPSASADLEGLSIPSGGVERQIHPSAEGAIADFGRSTVLFGTDAAAAPVVTVLAPDGQRLSFTPSFIVLANRVTGENYLVADAADATNCTGEITSPSAVTYFGAFGTLADVRYEYDWVGNSLEQFVVLNEAVSLPEGWSAGDVRLEVWTSWLAGEPSAVSMNPMPLRVAGVDGPEVDEADTEINFGVMRILGKGRAFSVGEEGTEMPVCKSWVSARADTQDAARTEAGSSPERRFVVEGVDFLSAQPHLEKLGKTGGHAALGPFKSTEQMLASRELPGQQVPAKSGSSMLLASGAHRRSKGSYEIDFSLQGCYPSPVGLVSLWRGETNAMDSVGANHGAISNVGFGGGKVQNGFNFDGTGGVVSVTNSSTLNFGAGVDFSIEVWIKPETTNTDYNVQTIVDKRYAPSGSQALGYALYLDNGRLAFQLSQNITNFQFTTYGPAGLDLRGTNWQHVAVTIDRDAADGLKFYTNGVLVRSYNPTNQAGDLSNTQPLLIGKHAQSGLNAGFKGGMDELTIYSRSLSSNEVASIYSAGAAGKCFNYVCVPPPTNVAGWWPGDNSNGDLGRGHPVTLGGGLGYGPGMVYRAFNFNAAGNYAKVSANADLDIGPSGTGMSLEAWISSTSTNSRPIISWASPTLTGVHLFQNMPRYGSVYVDFLDTSGVTHNLTLYDLLTTNTPTHVAATYDKASGWVKLYFNGLKMAQYNWGTFTPRTALDFYLGHFPSSGVSFSGLLDEPTVYDRALSEIEVSSIWFAGYGGKCKGTPPPTDSDADGLPDWWELKCFGNLLQTATGDNDGDGLSNAYECMLGYDPTNAHTGGSIAGDADKDYDGDLLSNIAELCLYGTSPTNAHTFNQFKTDAEYKLTAEAGSPYSEVGLEMQALPENRLLFRVLRAPPGAAYDLFFRSDFNTGNWSRYYSGSPGQTEMICPHPGTPFAFFCVGPTGDTDGDDLTGGYEIVVSKTSPDLPDSDRDYLLDGWEVKFALDPASTLGDSGKDANPDGDALSNEGEQSAGTDPKRHNTTAVARPAFQVSVPVPITVEGGTGAARFTFTRTGDNSKTVTLYYALGGTADYGADYTLNPAPTETKPPYSITIPAGMAARSLDVTALPDGDTSELSETVIVGLEPSPLEDYVYSKHPDRATATIRNNWCRSYDSNADLAVGLMSGLVASGNRLHLKTLSEPQFPYLNVACSVDERTGVGRNTVVRIDVSSTHGQIIGEYLTGPATRKLNPSRTTVDQYGNVWVANRDEDGQVGDYKKGSITRIGLIRGGTRCNADGSANQAGQYIKNPTYSTVQDRDGDGLIKTSRGLADILPWTNQRDGLSDVDTFGGVSTAEDEAITEFVRVEDWGTRTIAVDKFNDIWVGGLGDYFTHQKVNGLTAQVVPFSTFRMGIGGCGGYGGVIDKNGVLWSAGRGDGLLRLVPPSSFSENTTWNWKRLLNGGDYGLAVDPVTGKIWHSWLYYAPSGPTTEPLGALTRWEPTDGNPPQSQLIEHHGWPYAQGIVVDLLGNVWVAHAIGDGISHESATHVGHLRTDGTFIGNVDLLFGGVQGRGPTGLSVDSSGLIWVTCRDSNNAMRIDPTLGDISNGFHLGQVVDVVDLGDGTGQPPVPATPYNYSDMTGFNNNNVVNTGGCPLKGYWSTVEDAQSENALWTASWSATLGTGGAIEVFARASNERIRLSNQGFVQVVNGASLSGVRGRFLELRCALSRGSCGEDPYIESVALCAETSTVRLVKGLEDVSIPEGQKGTLEVVALGNGPLTYEWSFNGATIQGATASVLTINSADCWDSGSYTVRVTDDASGDFVISGPATLTVIKRGITIPASGIASVYPAVIDVNAAVPEATFYHRIDVTLEGLSHGSPDDLDILLVPPAGPPIMLMSDAGGQTLVSAKTFVFSTVSSASPPDDQPFPSAALLTYGASNFGETETSFPPPADGGQPAPQASGGYLTDLSLLCNENPNGEWRLYIVDDSLGASGAVADSWCITLTYY